MAVNESLYAGTGGAGVNIDPGWSPNLWKDCPWADLRANRNKGFAFEDYFSVFGWPGSASGGAVSGQCGPYPCYVYQGGSIAPADLQGGGITFSSDGDNEGAAMWGYATPMKLTSTLKKAWFEASIKSSTITDTKHGLFCGLTESYAPTTGVPIGTDDLLADKNLIGFHRLAGDGDMLDVVWKADGQTQVTALADAITLVADTFMKVGFYFNPDADQANRITFFYNGTPLTTYATSTQMAALAFPSDITLGLVFGVMNATGTTPGSSTLRWWRMAQQI